MHGTCERLQSNLRRAASFPEMCLLASNQSDIILPGNESGDVRDEVFVVPRSDQQRALSYQAKDLQENEMIEEHDAIRQQRPPHVPHRLRLIGT